MNKVVIKNGLVVHADREQTEDIRISDEKIVEVGPDLSASKREEVIDAKGKWVFPGIIDPHTHMGIPIKEQWSADNFESGSKSAINGGVTTIIDFSILGENQSLSESIAERKKLAENAICDVSLHCNFTHFSKELLNEIPSIIKGGISSFKVFTTYKESGMMLDYDQIEAVAKVIGDHNGILMVHAEDDREIENASGQIDESALLSPSSHGQSRPVSAEETAIRNVAKIADRTDCSMYIVHLNTAAGLEEAKRSGNILVETCPHYLLLDDSAYTRDDGRMFVASPPLRKPSDNRALWHGIMDGSIHTIGSDHCPFCKRQKKEDIPYHQIPNGMGGVETLFPVLLAQWISRDLPKSRLTQLMAANPAKIFGLDKKGSIAPGMDADLLIVNPNNLTSSWTSGLVSITDWNAYSDFPACFPEQVFLRGCSILISGRMENSDAGKFIYNSM